MIKNYKAMNTTDIPHLEIELMTDQELDEQVNELLKEITIAQQAINIKELMIKS